MANNIIDFPAVTHSCGDCDWCDCCVNIGLRGVKNTAPKTRVAFSIIADALIR